MNLILEDTENTAVFQQKYYLKEIIYLIEKNRTSEFISEMRKYRHTVSNYCRSLGTGSYMESIEIRGLL